jgi:hypothetical protein
VAGLRATLHPSIEAIPRAVWEEMLTGDPESYDYYRAVQPTPPPGFRLGAISVSDAERIRAVAPIFHINYRLDTALQGGLRCATDWLSTRLPGLLSLSVIGIGSPMSDNCAIGFSSELGPSDRVRMFVAMLDRLLEEARAHGISLLAVKSLGGLAGVLGECLTAHGYLRTTTVPLAILPVPFSNFDTWLDGLPKKERIYFRKKLKSADDVRIEYRTSIKGLEAQIFGLFNNTLVQSKVDYGDFEQLHPDYFTRVVDSLGERMQMMLCWKGEQLVSFQLCLIGRDRIINKHLGMKYPEARQLNLFFVSWLLLVRHAIDKRIRVIEMGATTYAAKLLFGGHLERRWLYFRCRWPIATAAVRPFLWLCDFERNDPELRKLKVAVQEQDGAT